MTASITNYEVCSVLITAYFLVYVYFYLSICMNVLVPFYIEIDDQYDIFQYIHIYVYIHI
jgi:hypothetical protein